MYYVYILRCQDESLYTGITTDVQRRFQEHLTMGKKAAKYTRVHGVRQIEACWTCSSRQEATQLEFWIKSLTKYQKENILMDDSYFQIYLNNKVEIEHYQRVERKL